MRFKHKLPLFIIQSLITLGFLCLNFWQFQSHTQSFHFGDETEHVTLGWMMANYDKTLYSDLSSNHQPLPILTGAAISKLIPYQNLFMEIEWLRRFMFLFSLIGSLILVALTGWAGVIFTILTETTKFYFFGYHVLAESLVVYPIAILTYILIQRSLKRRLLLPWLNALEAIEVGFLSFWLVFNLMPLLPFVMISLSCYLYKVTRPQKLLTLSTFLFFSLVLFSFIPIENWLQETILNTQRYFLPYESNLPGIMAKLSIALFPVVSLFSWNSIVGKTILTSGFIGLLAYISFVKSTRYKPNHFVIFIFGYLLLISLNLRVYQPSVRFYNGFHLLPWISFLLLLTSFCLEYLIKQKKWLSIVVSTGIILGAILWPNTQWWQENLDKQNTFFIQYGEDDSLGQAIKTIKNSDDTILVGELNGFLPIAASIPLSGRQNAYLPWSFRSPELRGEFFDLMKQSPPKFIYFPESISPYFEALKPYLDDDYIRVTRSDGSLTNLYIHTDKISQVPFESWENWERLLYSIPIEQNTKI